MRNKVFNDAYFQYQPTVLRYAMLFCGDTEFAKDICQEVFIKIWLRGAYPDNIENYNSYLFIVTRNLVMDDYRAKRRVNAVHLQLKDGCQPVYSVLPNRYDEQVYQKFFRNMVQRLPPQQRAVFTLVREHALPPIKVSSISGMNHITVRTTMQKVKRKLDKWISR